MELFKYRNRFGLPSYRRYKEVQVAANKRKIDKQWIDRGSIEWISARLKDRLEAPQFGICHGTRRGQEQAWFREFLDFDVIGTEISDSAKDFPHTIEWDFHEVKREWISACDLIYSNSWDHSYNPDKMFRRWMSCVKPGGVMVLTHTGAHNIVSETDPFGVTLDELCAMIGEIGGASWEIDVPDGAPDVVTTFGKGQTLECRHVFASLRAA